MKKVAFIGMALMLAACSDLSALTGSAGGADSSVKARMHSCLLTEGNNRLQAGTLFTNSISATAKEMVGTCVKKLALQSAGISAESQSMAETIISNLRTMSNAQ